MILYVVFLCGYNTKKKELVQSAVKDLKRPHREPSHLVSI